MADLSKADREDLSEAAAVREQTTITSAFNTIEIAIKVLSGMILLMGVLAAVFIGSEISDVTKNAEDRIDKISSNAENLINRSEKNIDSISSIYRDSIGNGVRTAIDEQLRGKETDFEERIAKLDAGLRDLDAKRLRMEALVGSLQDFVDIKKAQPFDYLAHYLSLDWDSADIVSDPKVRATHALALDAVITGGLLRVVRPNDIYNAAAKASSNKFTYRAHKLSAIAAWTDPSPVNVVRLLRFQVTLLDEFQFVDKGNGQWEMKSVNPENNAEKGSAIRKDSYDRIMVALRESPLPSNQLIYSEGWNVANITKDYETLINTLEASLKERDERAAKGDTTSHAYFPSYGHVTLAEAYGETGQRDWREKVEFHLSEAQRKLETESPAASWYSHTKADAAELRGNLKLDVKATRSSSTQTDSRTLRDQICDMVKRIAASDRDPTDDEVKFIMQADFDIRDCLE